MTYSKEAINLSNQIWNSFSSTGNDISPNDFHVILFLLSLRSYHIDYGKYNPTDPITVLNIYIQTGSFKFGSKNQNATLLFNTYIPLIEKMGIEKVEIFMDSLRLYDSSTILRNYSKIFELLLKKCDIYSEGRGTYNLPEEIILFISKLCTLPLNGNIYNPFAGSASFGLFSGTKNTLLFGDNSSTYLGQEKDPKTWAIGYLRLLAHKSSKKAILELGDSINDWNPKKQNFDLVVSAPPLGFKLTPSIYGKFGIINNAQHYFIEKGIESLKAEGKLIAVISNNTLFSTGAEYNLRQSIVANDILEMVISMPSGLLVHTNIPLSLVVINKNKNTKGEVRMVDASSYFTSQTKKEKQLDYKSVIQLIESNITNDSQKFITNEEIINNDYNITPSRYLFDELPHEMEAGHDLKKLGDLAPLISSNKISTAEIGKLIKIRDLKDNNLDYILALDSIQDGEIPKNAHKLKETCLLISLRGKSIKPTYFNFTGESIYLPNDIVALKVDESTNDFGYLINELHSEYVLNQIDAFRTGAVIPALKKSDLLNVNIIVPSLSEQKAKVEGIKEAFIQSQKKELALKQELLGLKDESFREFASIKHTFRQYLNALQSNVAGTKKFIANNEGTSMSLDMVYSKNLNKTFGEHLSGLEGTIQSMSKMLSSFDNSNEELATKKLNLLQLVTEAHNRFKNTDIFKFEKVYVDTDSFTMFDDTIFEPTVLFNEDDFYKLYSNIVSNAIEHGFKDKTKIYSIRTSISFDDKEKKCVLEIANNGIPMPKEFTIKHLTTRGEKTSDSNGTGIGGADIKAILDKYNGSFEVINQEDDFFPVTYLVKLPYKYDASL